jgi:phage shock protein PspC (stress-responsive transcriptional regulator)
MEQLGDVPTSDTAPPAGPPPPGPPEPPDRVIGGVAATMAAGLGVDPLWVRLGFVVLGLVGGIGVVVYGAWWLVLIGGSWSRPMRIAGGALLVAGMPLLVAGGARSFVTGPFAVILLLAGLALALWQPGRNTAPPAPVPAPLPPPVAPGEPGAPTRTWEATPGGEDSIDGPWKVLADGMQAPVVAAQRRRLALHWPHRRDRSMLGRLTLCAAIYVGAAWALADQIDGGRLHPEQWLGAAAVVCGAGMVVGMFRGHARWLIVPAVLAAGAGYVGGTMARLGITTGDLADDRHVSVGNYTGSGDIDERVGVGDLQISVDSAPPAPVHVDARVGLGRIQLYVASDVTVELRPRVDHGSISSSRGGRLSETAPTRIGDGTTADVVVDAWVGRGDIEVTVFDTPVVSPGDPILPRTTLPGGPQVPEEAGALVPIRDGVAMTTDGWVVLGNGEAVISPDGEVTATQDSIYPEPDGSQTVNTGWGPFRLLPRSLLLTPDGQVLDLQALRADVAAAAATTTPATPVPTVPPSPTTPSTIAGG